MAFSKQIPQSTDDAKEQIQELREQVQQLMSQRVTPALADAAGRAETAVHTAKDFTTDQAAALSDRVRDQPLIAILVAAGVGYLVGRIAG